MLMLYCRRGGRIVGEARVPGEPLPDGLVWADILDPTAGDIHQIKQIAGIEVPTPEEMREIEPSSRLYRDGLALFMTASVINQIDTASPETRAITLVLADGLLTTVRYATPTPFITFRRASPRSRSCAPAPGSRWSNCSTPSSIALPTRWRGRCAGEHAVEIDLLAAAQRGRDPGLRRGAEDHRAERHPLLEGGRKSGRPVAAAHLL
ncbi:MAG: hypothetical protein IPK78_21005 [Rhodospirillales bacterium]|nr:hypothetical protein [Rhodospirillales bacterium]